MNQIRNLITTNLFSLLILFGISSLVNKLNTENTFLDFCLVFVIVLIITVFARLFYFKALGYEDEYYHPPLIAPIPLFITLFLGITYLLGRVKFVKSNDYKVIAYYNHGRIFIFYFDLFKIQGLNELYFNGTDQESEKLVELIDKHYNFGLIGNSDNFKFNFRYWDGMLDDASRRKDTIDNIKKS